MVKPSRKKETTGDGATSKKDKKWKGAALPGGRGKNKPTHSVQGEPADTSAACLLLSF